MLPARAEIRMSKEKSAVRDLIKSDCFLIEIVARRGLFIFVCGVSHLHI